jgi:hypothetical protein
VQTCRALRDAGHNDSVWYAKSLERYPPSTLILAPRSSYADFRSLRLNDNAENASIIIPFPKGLSSDYKMNRPDYFFDCCITGLQYNRTNDSLKLFFDCRGEVDLRDPLTSSIAFVVHRSRPCRRELREELTRLTTQRHELREVVERLEHVLKNGPGDAAARHLAALRALNITSHRLYTLNTELQDCSNIAFSDLVTVLRPSRKDYHYSVKKSGHYKGWIQFDRIFERIHRLQCSDVPTVWPLKKQILQHGMDLVFTYANPVPVLPQLNQIDYHPATILNVPPGVSFLEAVLTHGKFAPHEEFSDEFLVNESVEEELKRFEHVMREMEVGGRGGRGRRASAASWFV